MERQVFILSHPLARRNAAHACAVAPDGYRVEIKERTRTLDQNDLLWSILTDLSKQVDWSINGKLEKLSPEDWKDILTASLDQEHRIAEGIRGGFVMLGRRTSKMGVRKMSELISFARSVGDEKGVQWSPTSIGREA